MILSSCVSSFLHLLWRVMISLTLWVSGFEVTHLFSDIEVHPLYPWGFFLLRYLFWELFVFLPHVFLLTWNKLKWFRAGCLIPQLKSWLWFCTYHTACSHKGKKQKCLDENKICNFINWEKNSLVWNLHIVEAPCSIPPSVKWLYLCLLFSYRC